MPRERPGDISTARQDNFTPCTPDNPFGRSRSSEPTIRADDGTSRTQQEYDRDRAKSDYELADALYGWSIYALRLTPAGPFLAGAETLHDLLTKGGGMAWDALKSKGIEQIVKEVARRNPKLKGANDVLEHAIDTVLTAVEEGGAAAAERRRAASEARAEAAEARRAARSEVQTAVDRGEHRQRVAPGTMLC